MNKDLLLLFFALFIAMTGFGITLPALPFFIERLVPTGDLATRLLALHVGGLTSAYAFTQFAAAPVCGVWSDRYGRKPLIVIGLVGFAASQVVFALGSSLQVLYGMRLIGGVFAAAILTAASAYVADTLSGDARGRGMAWLGTSQSLGFVVGPLMGGLLSRHDWHVDLSTRHLAFDGFSIPFLAAAGLALLTVPFIAVRLPESIATDPRASTPGRRITTSMLRGELKPLLILVLVSQGAIALFETVFALYSRRVLGLSLIQIGYAFAVCGVVMAVAQGGAAGLLAGRVRRRHQIAAGFAMLGTGLVLLLSARTFTATAWMVGILAFGIALVAPNLLTSIANRSGVNVGAALGLRNAFGSLGQIGGPLIGGVLFSYQSGLPFLITGGLALAIAAYITIRSASFQFQY